MRVFAFGAALCLALMPIVASAQQQPVFESYEDMRAELDPMMTERRIRDVMMRFGGPTGMTADELDTLERQVQALFPEDFTNVAVIARREMENGFAHELIAYWTGFGYLYVLVLMHERESDFVAINIRFNTSVYELLPDL